MGIMKKAILGCQSILLLGILSAAASNDNFIICVSEDLVPNTSPLKENSLNRNDLQLCNLWHNLQKNIDYWTTSNKNKPNGEDKPNRSITDGRFLKMMRTKKLFIDVPQLNAEKKILSTRSAKLDRKNLMAENDKRGPGFRSWGGKRGAIEEYVNEPEKKTGFASWGGKRNWKVLINDFPIPNIEKYKKKLELLSTDKYDRNDPAGDRLPLLSQDNCLESGERCEEDIDMSYDLLTGENPSSIDKNLIPIEITKKSPPQFQSWGGKRTGIQLRQNPFGNGYLEFFPPIQNDYKKISNQEDRANFFYRWNGKRTENEKFDIDKPLIRNFNSWGGKKRSKFNKDFKSLDDKKKMGADSFEIYGSSNGSPLFNR